MKTVGFLNEHDLSSFSVSYAQLQNGSKLDDTVVKKISGYLSTHGVLLFGWMGYTYDVETKEPINPHCYHTDGEWVWPSYLCYYLIKFKTFPKIEDFLIYLEKINYLNNINLTEKKRYEMENELSKYF